MLLHDVTYEECYGTFGYGARFEPHMGSTGPELLGDCSGMHRAFKLVDVDGKTVRAIPRDVQFEPVRDFIIHIDFLRLGKEARIKVNVPVHFKGQDVSPGIKQGGALNIVSHSVALSCSANLIPDEIVVPLREAPGTSASTCASPIATASASRTVSPVNRTVPGSASCSIRAARWLAQRYCSASMMLFSEP